MALVDTRVDLGVKQFQQPWGQAGSTLLDPRVDGKHVKQEVKISHRWSYMIFCCLLAGN